MIEPEQLQNGDEVAIRLNNQTHYFKFNFRRIENKQYIFLSIESGSISLRNIKHILAKGSFNSNILTIDKTINVQQAKDYLNFLIENDIIVNFQESPKYYTVKLPSTYKAN